MDNNYMRVRDSRQRLKAKLVEYKGGKCEICGYSKCIDALDFHHLNPEEKQFNLSSAKVSFEKAKKEVDKCILVCANCHREIHYTINQEKQQKEKEQCKQFYIEALNDRENSKEKKIRNSYLFLKETDIFKDMENQMSRNEIFQKYHINNRTFNKFLKENGITYNNKKVVVNKPSKEELIELLKTYNVNQISKMYDVSYNGVKKWCKKFNIT